jgi:arginyl-tRNA synthetase
MKLTVRNLISEALSRAKESGTLTLENLPDVVVEEPKDKKFGDYSTNIAMLLAKSERKSPRAIAESICGHFNDEPRVQSADCAGPGFINIKMSDSFFAERLGQAREKGEDFGKSALGGDRKINLEYVSANPTGPLHVGHGRGAAVGDTLGNILQFAGYEVCKEYYVNDVGNQINILGNSTWLRYLEVCGQTIDFPDDHYKGDYIKGIASEIFDKHEKGFLSKPEEESKRFFKTYANDWVLSGIKSDLKQFRVGHDVWFSEKSLHDDGKVKASLGWLREKGHIYDEDGATWVKTSPFGDEKDRVIIKQDGSQTYFCSDIAYHKDKIDRGFYKIIDIWGADHHGYIPRMQAVLEAMEFDKEVFKVALVQFVTLKRGGEKVQMSTRSGEFVTLSDVVDEVGVDAARFFFLMRSSDSHLDFDLELAKQKSNDNPVFYVQYAHARISNVFFTAKDNEIDMSSLGKANLSLFAADEIELAKKVLSFPEVIEKAAESLEGHRLTYYLQELAANFHSYYKKNRVVTDDIPLTLARLALLECVRNVIKQGLSLMGISAPDKM